MSQTVASPLGVGVEQHLRVGVSQKCVTLLLEPVPQLRCVVQLPVIDQVIVYVVPEQGHGLLSACRVYDRQPGVQQNGPGKLQNILLVGTTPDHGL